MAAARGGAGRGPGPRLADARDLVAGAVGAARVGHGVSVVAVRVHLLRHGHGHGAQTRGVRAKRDTAAALAPPALAPMSEERGSRRHGMGGGHLEQGGSGSEGHEGNARAQEPHQDDGPLARDTVLLSVGNPL